MIATYLMLTTKKTVKTICKVESVKVGKLKAKTRHQHATGQYWIGQYRDGILEKTFDIS